MDRLEAQRLAMLFWRLPIILKFPGEHCCVIFIVAECLALWCLMFFAKMRASRFVALKGVLAHKLGELQEIGNAPGAFQRLVKIFVSAQHSHMAPELLPQLGNFLQRFAQSSFVARHSAFVPEQKAELAVK